MVDIFLEEMGLEGHQVVYGLHGNTENIHLHIAVNRMNEETGLVVRPNNGFDIIQAHKALAVIEDTFGWKPEDNAVFRVVDGEVVKQVKRAKLQPSQPAQTFEQHTGIKSAERIAQEESHAIILGATSWEDLHKKLAPLGMRYIKKGSGAIIQVDDTPVKASSVDRAFALGKMEKRLGKFVPGVYEEEKATHPRPPQPVSEVNIDEWRMYQEAMEKRDISGIREQEQRKLEEQRRQIDEEAKAKHAKVGSIIGKHGLYVGNIARNAIGEERRQKRAALLREHRRNQRKIATRPTFKQWLKKYGKKDKANVWRYRKQLEQLAHPETLPPVPPVETDCPQLKAFNIYHEAVGATRYRVTSIKFEKDGTKKALILDKKNGVSEGFTPDELREHMGEMLKLQNRGENLYFTPLSDTHNFIVVDDMTAESVEQMKKDYFKPCAVIESSPGNFQCILAYKKFEYYPEFDREMANRVAKELNEKYGDPNLSGAVHPHRAPYFGNFKEKHRKANGRFPAAMLRQAEHRECSATWSMAKGYIEKIQEEQARRRETLRVIAKRSNIPYTSATAAYYAHFDNICEIYGRNENMDMSRVDAMIAVRMRSNGHSQTAVENAILQCAPSVRGEQGAKQHQWEKYATRTANYAFGPAGDIVMQKHAGQKRNWERVEEEKILQEQQAQRSRMR